MVNVENKPAKFTSTMKLEQLLDLNHKLHAPQMTEWGPCLTQLQQKASQPDGFTPTEARAIYRLLARCLLRPMGGKMRGHVRHLLQMMSAKQPPDLLVASLSETFGFLHSLPPLHHHGRIALEAFTWSFHAFQNSSEPPTSLISLQAQLLTAIVAAENNNFLKTTASCRLQVIIRKPHLVDFYFKALSRMEPSYESLVLWSFIVKLLSDAKQLSSFLIADLKKIMLDHFSKVALSGKTGLPSHILICTKPIIKTFNHDEFRQTLMPLINKALLRNAELVMETYGFILESVSLDLSQYASEFGQLLKNHISSKDEKCQNEAIIACKHLSMQCSNGEAIQELLTLFFDVLNGTFGKLTIASQRLGVLTAIGNLSYNIVVGANTIDKLCEYVCQNLITVLKQEVHEGILVTTLKQLSLWGCKFSTGLPTFVLEWFKTGFTLKTSTSLVRCSYLQCIYSSVLKNQESTSLQILMTYLTKTIDTSLGSSININLVTEALLASCILIKLDISPDSLIKKICDVGKSPIFTEKYFASANQDNLKTLLILTENLLLDHFDNLNPDSKPLIKVLAQMMLHSNVHVRKPAHSLVTKVGTIFQPEHFIHPLLQEIKSLVFTNNEVNSQALQNSLFVLSTSKNDLTKEEGVTIAKSMFLIAHHQHVGSWKICHFVWAKILKHLNLDELDLFTEHHQEFYSLVTDFEGFIDTSRKNALQTLNYTCSDIYIPLFVEFVLDHLKDTAFLEVTQADFAIFETPEGEVYDKSVYESYKEGDNFRNMKRESKLYSYKEQLAEIELKKELEAKKKAQNPGKQPELTKKQQELKAAQHEKEALIRSRVKKLEAKLIKYLSLLKSIFGDNPCKEESSIKRQKLLFLTQILDTLLSLLASPLSAPAVLDMLTHLGVYVTEKPVKGAQIAQLIFRVSNPASEPDPAWIFPDLGSSIITLLSQIANQAYTPPFTLCFPLLKWVLLNSNISDERKLTCIKILQDHSTPAKFEDSCDPIIDAKLLPFLNIIDVLIKVIDKDSSTVKILAKQVVLQVISLATRTENEELITFSEVSLLLEALKSENLEKRNITLECLSLLTNNLTHFYIEHEQMIMKRFWIAKFDVDEANAKLATSLWKESRLRINDELCLSLLEDIASPLECLRISTAKALAEALSSFPHQVHSATIQLMALYREHKYIAPILLDNFNRVIAEPPPDKWEPRSGVAKAFNEIALLLNESIVSELMSFFLSDGLGDPNEKVRKDMLDSAVKIVDTHGKENINVLLPMLEEFLSETPETSAYDDVRQGVVILMGTLAHHLEKTDPKIKPIISKLVQTLSTPSQQVQEAVANCLPPLVSAIKEDAPKHVKKLLDVLLESQKYGEKRGAAYGLAGFVKGLGILSLKQLNIIDILVQAIQNKKDPKQREGALLAFEMLCNMLGRLFEPYIVHVLPNLLICFGDHDRDVRRATDETAKAVMSKLSAHGVKLVLPSLLAALEEESWRTKASSVELLGAMAFCAPKQLSSCLPNIVPKLIEVLSDSHPKVQKAGAQALKLIGSVIRNPEIQAIVEVLLEALQDPSKKTSACLTNLLNTKFVHFIDAPSLALIMPVVHRAFQDRSTETRKMAAQIIGNMYSLTDQKDLEPYLPTILPGLKQSLLDPVPEVRTVSARALGTMAKGMGETSLVELKPWLLTTLTSETSSVDRSGAAQGLSEVLGGLGIEKLHALMPEFISRAERTDIQPHVKDGYIMMFIYLPMVFNKEFTPFIGPITKPILKALADENEFVRDTALKAGQRIVNMYAETSIELLLPELEKGLFDDNWRIRYSSIQLLGDLLYKISGVSGKMSTESADDDDNFGTEQSQKAILRALGTQRHQRVLAGLYMGRSDVGLMVRQAALHVWKVVVSNTPRTLREILPTLFSLLLGCLASNSHDKRQIAAKTLGDLVRKLGERVLPEIIPILEKGLDSQEPDQRQGVCIGLSEIMSSTSKEMVLTFFDSLVPTVRRALSDELPEVRKAAAKTFDSLHSNVGVRALDEILPPLLEQLNDPEKFENTLDGLKQVMAIKSKVVLPYLIPQLTSSPVNTKALALLSTVAGDPLTKHLNKVLPALLTALGEAQGTPSESQVLEHCQAVVMSVSGEQGIRTLIDFLLEASRHESIAEKKAAVALLSAFCSQSKAELSYYVPQLLRGLIHLYTYTDEDILKNSWEALNSVTKTLDPVAQLQHVSDVRQAVRFAVSDLKGQDLLPGFCQPKGIMPILPIFREAILNGTPEAKEQASHGLGEVIKLTNSEALKPSVVNITGPLIRILGDRFTWNVKVAVLETLALLLHKVGAHLKPFLPQLQATFLKSLSDPNRTVRLRAASAFSHLIGIHSKSESLFVELHSAIKSVEDLQIKETNIYALRCVIRGAGDKMSEGTRNGVVMTLTSHLACSDESLRQVAASCLGTIAKWLPPSELFNLAQEYMLDDDITADWVLRHAKSIALMVALKEAPARVCVNLYDGIVQSLFSFLGADRLPIALSGVRATTYFFAHCINTGQPLPSSLIQVYSKSMNHSCNEVKQVLAQGISFLTRACSASLPPPLLKSLLPQLVNGTKEKNSMVRANSEFALVAILGLREGHDAQPFLSLLDPGAREALADVIQKVLRKVAAQPLPKEEEFDCTLLT